MSSLSQYHPFRDSVTKSAVASEAVSSPVQSETKGDDKEREYQPWLSFKIKMRVVVFTVVILAIWYVISSFFKENPDLQDGFYSSVHDLQRKTRPTAIEKPVSIFDEHDLDERGRSISESKSKVGFINSLFCRGGKRASFCD